MKRVIAVIVTGLALMAAEAFAGNGDLIVDGNLGVGTTIPADKLEVSKFGAGSLVWPLVVSNFDNNPATPSGTAAGIKFRMSDPVDGSFKWAGIAGVSETSWSNTVGLSFYTGVGGQQERMRISDAGNVGIGTANPTGKLSIVTNQNLGLSVVGNNNGYMGADVYIGRASTNPSVGRSANIQFGDDATGYASLIQSYQGQLQFFQYVGAGWNETFRIAAGGNVGIGTATPNGKLDVWGSIAVSGTVVHSSDAKFKKNLLPINTALGKLLSLNGYSYEWKTEEYKEKGFPNGRHYGVIAQEIEKVLPEVVNTAPDGSKAVAYTEIIPVLIEAIKEQQKRIESLEKKLAEVH